MASRTIRNRLVFFTKLYFLSFVHVLREDNNIKIGPEARTFVHAHTAKLCFARTKNPRHMPA